MVLKDAKGRELKRTKTDKKGVYTFKDVAPGRYRVFCTISGQFGGSAAATVTKEKGETIQANLELVRTP